MSPPDNKDEIRSNPRPQGEEMRKYGIHCVLVEQFHYREFRYANLKDAIAQARRDEKSHEREWPS
jgi:hypothetical protein